MRSVMKHARQGASVFWIVLARALQLQQLLLALLWLVGSGKARGNYRAGQASKELQRIKCCDLCDL